MKLYKHITRTDYGGGYIECYHLFLDDTRRLWETTDSWGHWRRTHWQSGDKEHSTEIPIPDWLSKQAWMFVSPFSHIRRGKAIHVKMTMGEFPR